MTIYSSYTPIPELEANEIEHRRKLAKGVNLVGKGKMNAVTTLTLTANVASTTLTDARITPQSFIGFQPLTSNAAAALSTTYITTTNQTNGSAVITHANNAQTDRDFRILIIG